MADHLRSFSLRMSLIASLRSMYPCLSANSFRASSNCLGKRTVMRSDFDATGTAPVSTV